MDDDKNSEQKIPPYVCCVLTEETWTWFAAILFFVILLLVATLKYCRKYFSKPKFETKNLTLLRRTLIEDDGDALGKIKLTPIKVEEFVKYCNTRRKHTIIDTLEFDKTNSRDDDSGVSYAIAKKNKAKNQNQDVIAQDGNRVVLTGQPENGDYINATRLNMEENYLNRTWIVTQGPMDSTIEDFWRLIWQADIRLVVMLTKTFEVVRLMCSQYWPLHMNAPENYGVFQVELIKEERYAHFKVRHMILRCTSDPKAGTRPIVQFHYTSWPLSAQPDNSQILLFRRHISTHLQLETSRERPALVHCHDGGGRSGTFLAIEANLSMVETRGLVDIFGTVKWLQEQRALLVSHSGFYRLIYDILEDYIKCGDTSTKMEDFLNLDGPQYWKLDGNMLHNKEGLWKSNDMWNFTVKEGVSQKELIYVENINETKVWGTTNDGKVILEIFEEDKAEQLWKKGEPNAEGYFTLENYEVSKVITATSSTSLELKDQQDELREHGESNFKTLASLRPHYTIGDCAAGHRAENRDKNRNVLVVPPDDNRPYLTSFQSNSTTDYINAVFVDGFCQAEAMIVTEWPMQSTVANFWSMVYDHDCSTVVVLNNPPVPGKVTRNNKSFVRFWPEDGYSSYGPVFSINTVDMKHHADFTMWHFRLGKKEIAPHRKFHAISMEEKKNKKQDTNNSASSTSLSTMLLQGLEAPAKLVKLYQVNAWPQDSDVSNLSPDVLINLLGDVRQWHDSVRENHMNSDGSSNHPNRIAVVSCDGMSRAGVYCATFTSIEQVATTKTVDIFNAVKCARKSRPQLVESLEEYCYIHDTVKQFVKNISN